MPTKTTESAKYTDTMRAEYDMRGGVRGKYVHRFRSDMVMVTLDPDVAAAFPNAEAVNNALRSLMEQPKETSTVA